MLARVATADREAVVVQHLIIERIDQIELLTKRRGAFTSAGCEIARHLPRQPRTPLNSAADHDCVGTRSGERPHGILER